MTCARCADLCQEVPIRTPGELEKAVRVAGANLDDGAIIETSGGESSTPFAELRSAGPRPDFIETDFKCVECGERFHLRCETYHGQGGRWSYG